MSKKSLILFIKRKEDEFDESVLSRAWNIIFPMVSLRCKEARVWINH